MTDVKLHLPSQVVDAVSIEMESPRGGDFISIMIDGVEVVTAVTTAAALAAQVGTLAASIRRWAAGQRRPAKLRLKSRYVNLTVDLQPNVSTVDIVEAVSRLLEYQQETDDAAD